MLKLLSNSHYYFSYILGIALYPIMLGKPQWPAVATLIADNIRKHGLILGMYIDTTLALMDEGHKPPSDTFKAIFQATLTFITKTKNEPNNQTILDKIQKAADAFF